MEKKCLFLFLLHAMQKTSLLAVYDIKTKDS